MSGQLLAFNLNLANRPRRLSIVRLQMSCTGANAIMPLEKMPLGGTIYYGNTLQAYGTSSIYGVIADYPVTMRATPTVSQSGTFGAYTATSGNNSMNSTIGNLSATSHAWRTGGWSGTSNLTAAHASVLFANNGAKLMADAEL